MHASAGSPHTPGATPNALSHLPTPAAPSSESHIYLSQTTRPTPTAPHVTNRPRPENDSHSALPPPMWSKQLLLLLIPAAATAMQSPRSNQPKSRALGGQPETSRGYRRGERGTHSFQRRGPQPSQYTGAPGLQGT